MLRLRWIHGLIALIMAVGLITGCGGSGNSGETEGLSGSINISGSSTVYPVTTAVAEEFMEEHPNVSISISRDGSSGGFENAFLPNRSDINNSSRPIHPQEVEEAQEAGFEPIEFQVARDALTVAVNNDNDWVGECMTLDTLREIWSPDSPPETWQDLNPDWPDGELDLYGPASTSGTFDYFSEHVVGEVGRIRSDFEGTEEDDLIAQGIAGSQYAHGYFPYAYYMNNPAHVKALEMDAGEGCVAPSLENAASGNYPLARPLFIYVNSERLKENETLQEFVRFYIRMTGDRQMIAEDIGYVPMNEQTIQDHLDKLEQNL